MGRNISYTCDYCKKLCDGDHVRFTADYFQHRHGMGVCDNRVYGSGIDVYFHKGDCAMIGVADMMGIALQKEALEPIPEERALTLDREELRLGKYTKGCERWTPEQLRGLLWLLGEWTCRVDHDGSVKGAHARGQAAFKALLNFNRNPLTIDEVQELMRNSKRVN